MQPEEVFTPGIFPAHTYVPRGENKYEKILEESLGTPGMLVSVLGPSKTGKTVLLERVVGTDEIRIPGIGSADKLWRKVLALLNIALPSSRTSSTGGESSGKVSIGSPSAGLAGEATHKKVTAKEETQSVESAPFETAVIALIEKKKVLVLDDFHYVDRPEQIEIAKQLKEAISKKLRIVVLAVPHGADDPIRANPDLRGRVINVDLGSWTKDELCEIGIKGFPLLGYKVQKVDLERLATEALGSPQLMQALCLSVCRLLAKESKYSHDGNVDLGAEGLGAVSRMTSTIADAKTPFDLLSAGPQRHGTERSTYDVKGGFRGDVYTVILRALRENEPKLSLTYDEMRERIGNVVVGTGPQGQQWAQALGQMDAIVKDKLPKDRVLEWDSETKILSISDPYFLFYLRWKIWPE